MTSRTRRLKSGWIGKWSTVTPTMSQETTNPPGLVMRLSSASASFGSLSHCSRYLVQTMSKLPSGEGQGEDVEHGVEHARVRRDRQVAQMALDVSEPRLQFQPLALLVTVNGVET